MGKLFIFSMTLLTIYNFAWAGIDPWRVDAQQVVEFTSEGGAREMCFLPKHLDIIGAKYSSKDTKNELKLCSYDLYLQPDQAEEGIKPVAVCAKAHSTNPSLEMFKFGEYNSRESFEENVCTKKSGVKSNGKKLAKYKLSYSCSKTQSILGYYHVSRILGGILDVPQSVVRTVDIHTQYKYAVKAENILLANGQACVGSELRAAGNLIGSIWCNLREVLEHAIAGSPGRNKSRDNILTEDEQFTYGALSVNPRKENFYSAFFYRASDQQGRLDRFKNESSIYKRLTSSNPISSMLVGNEFSQKNLQTVVVLKDASDMMLIDFLLNQKDRFGNIHYKNTPYAIVEGELQRVKSGVYTNQVVVKKMLLKDNDCGLKSSMIKKSGLLQGLRHFSKQTYDQLIRLSDEINEPYVESYFRQSLLFTDNDFQTFRENTLQASRLFEEKCNSGQLKLDLNANSIFTGSGTYSDSCAVTE